MVNMVKNKNCVIWIQTALLFTQNLTIFIKILQKMLDKAKLWVQQAITKRRKKVTGLMKNEFCKKVMK